LDRAVVSGDIVLHQLVRGECSFPQKDEESPDRDELEAPLGELIVAGRRQMAAGTDRGRAAARAHRDLDALLIGAEAGVLIERAEGDI
jgi:hypothetical protein